MNMEKHEEIGQRIHDAWNGTKGSVALPGLTLWSAIGLFDKIFGWGVKIAGQDWIDKNGKGLFIAWVAGLVFWFLVSCRSVFKIAEKAGATERKLKELNDHCEACKNSFARDHSAHIESEKCLHAVIHNTRDALLKNCRIDELLALSPTDLFARFIEVVKGQMGQLEKAMRALSGAECSVILKLRKQETLVHSDGSKQPGFVTVACGPNALGRTGNNTTVLPTIVGVAARAVLSKTIEYTNCASKDRTVYLPPGTTKLKYETIVVAPFYEQDEIIGVLCFDWEKPDMYKEEYFNLVAAFTDILDTAFHLCNESFFAKVGNTTKGWSHG